MIKHVLMAECTIAPGHHGLSDIREVSDQELEALSLATGLLGHFGGSYSLYEICTENYGSLVAFLEGVSQMRGANEEFAHQFVITLNTRLLNFLTSFRTFIDHQETQLKRLGSSDGDWYGIFKQRTAYHYDRSFPYRFLWVLRNYVQHCGLPPQGFTVGLQPNTAGQEVKRALVYLDRDGLLANYKDWKTVKGDLLKQPEKIELLPCISELHSCITDLARLTAAIHIKRMGAHWNFLVHLFNEVTERFPDGVPCIARIELGSDSRPIAFNVTPLPVLGMQSMQAIWAEMNGATSAWAQQNS